MEGDHLIALVLSVQRRGELPGEVLVKAGHPLLDDYLVFPRGEGEAELGGHSSTKTTLDTYGHLFPDEQDRTRAFVD
jgi:hypothetical protein